MLILSNQNYNKNEIQNVRVQNLASAPGTPVTGQIYYDTTLNQFGVYQNATWVYLAPSVSNVITRAAAAGAANELIVAAGADRTAQAFTTNGLLKIASGVVASAVAGTDYLTASSTNSLTNKTIDAAGTGNSITNLTTSNFAVNVIDTDTALTANSDTRIASQKAVKAYVDAVSTSAMKFKGVIDASSNPNYPAAVVGDMYKISVSGKIGGASGTTVTVGDAIVAIAITASGTEAAVGANWDVIQANVDAATTGTQGLTQYATSAEAEAKSLTTRSLTPASVVNFPVKKIFTIGDGTTTAIVVTHSLGTQDITVSIRDASTNAFVQCDVTATSTTTATLTFAIAPAAAAYKVVVIG